MSDNLYNKIKETSDGINDYTASAKLSIQSQNHDVDIQADPKVNIPFNFDMESRSWGIAGISMMATSTIQVNWEEVTYGENDQEQRTPRSAKVDLSTAEVEWVAGGFYGIDELVLSVTTDGGVANARLVMVYIDKKEG